MVVFGLFKVQLRRKDLHLSFHSKRALTCELALRYVVETAHRYQEEEDLLVETHIRSYAIRTLVIVSHKMGEEC